MTPHRIAATLVLPWLLALTVWYCVGHAVRIAGPVARLWWRCWWVCAVHEWRATEQTINQAWEQGERSA